MKYIRTKDGKIFDYEPIHNIDVDGFIVQHINGWEKPLMREDIVKITDTIPELCDEFVRVSKSVHDFLISDDIPTKKFGDTEIYGAIWTEWGLKYAAKMNDKGEMELL